MINFFPELLVVLHDTDLTFLNLAILTSQEKTVPIRAPNKLPSNKHP